LQTAKAATKSNTSTFNRKELMKNDPPRPVNDVPNII